MEVERLQQEVQSSGSPTRTHFLARPGSPTAEDQVSAVVAQSYMYM